MRASSGRRADLSRREPPRSHVQRCDEGTSRITSSTWAPQPDHEVRPQFRHRMREHIRRRLARVAGRPYPHDPCDLARGMRTEGRGMSIGRTRGVLYLVARLLGDVQAVKKGRVGRRVGRRVVGRVTGRGIGRLFR
jgi:hypothetical protein